jgi:MOSC domain-containing protein YiiM
MQGKVLRIFIAGDKGLPMREVSEVMASREAGLAGDRYGKGKGSWSTPGKTHRQVSIISIEAINAANDMLLQPFDPSETRRNIVVNGIYPNELIGREFTIGEARLRGTKLCDPCQRPAHLAGKGSIDFEGAFHDRGGLCAEVVEDGMIYVGDGISVEVY